MKEKTDAYPTCPIRHVLSRFGDKWSLLVLYQIYMSERKVLRFSELKHLMEDCSQKMLSQTLRSLENSHLLQRKVYPVVPPKVEYSFTETGLSLMPAVLPLIDWAVQHFGDVVTDKVIVG